MVKSSGVSGLVAMVSGGGSGIGAATADTLSERGADIVVVDVDETCLKRKVDAILHKGRRAVGVVGNVARDGDCKRTVFEAMEAFGRLDILVNNAGVGSFNATLETTTEAEWDRVIGINLKGVFLLSRHAAPAIRQSGGGCIVNVASVHALATAAGVLAYAASKGGVVAMTRAMAIELASDQIRVVAVLPGAIDTPMLQLQAKSQGKSYEELGFATAPGAIGRVGDPKEVAEAIAFVASRAASLVNGTAMVVDGGLLASFA